MTQVLTPGTAEFNERKADLMRSMIATPNGASMATRTAWKLGQGDPVNEWNACFQLARAGFTWNDVLNACT